MPVLAGTAGVAAAVEIQELLLLLDATTPRVTAVAAVQLAADLVFMLGAVALVKLIQEITHCIALLEMAELGGVDPVDG